MSDREQKDLFLLACARGLLDDVRPQSKICTRMVAEKHALYE